MKEDKKNVRLSQGPKKSIFIASIMSLRRFESNISLHRLQVIKIYGSLPTSTWLWYTCAVKRKGTLLPSWIASTLTLSPHSPKASVLPPSMCRDFMLSSQTGTTMESEYLRSFLPCVNLDSSIVKPHYNKSNNKSKYIILFEMETFTLRSRVPPLVCTCGPSNDVRKSGSAESFQRCKSNR